MIKAYEKTLYLFLLLLFIVAILPHSGQANNPRNQNLSVNYEELSAVEFLRAIESAKYTCIIPLGILEKHGPHLPLGTDLIDVRAIALRAAREEYSIVFPPYYFGQIFEAKHQPGTIAYSHEIIWNLLQETCDELARNGIKKIILVNGHGGNNYFLRYFCQEQLSSKKDYAVYLFLPSDIPEIAEKIEKLRKTTNDGHAGEQETSTMFAHRPDLVKLDVARDQDGSDQNRLDNIHQSYVGIWWYAKYPHHYAGDGSAATEELGTLLLNTQVDQLVQMIKEVKDDDNVINLQNRFFKESENPLQTEQ